MYLIAKSARREGGRKNRMTHTKQNNNHQQYRASKSDDDCRREGTDCVELYGFVLLNVHPPKPKPFGINTKLQMLHKLGLILNSYFVTFIVERKLNG